MGRKPIGRKAMPKAELQRRWRRKRRVAEVKAARQAKATAFQLDPDLLKTVQEVAAERAKSVTAAVEEGLRLWLARAKRQKSKASTPSDS